SFDAAEQPADPLRPVSRNRHRFPLLKKLSRSVRSSSACTRWPNLVLPYLCFLLFRRHQRAFEPVSYHAPNEFRRSPLSCLFVITAVDEKTVSIFYPSAFTLPPTSPGIFLQRPSSAKRENCVICSVNLSTSLESYRCWGYSRVITGRARR